MDTEVIDRPDTAEAAATATTYKDSHLIGRRAIFIAYSDENLDPIFQPGQLLLIEDANENGVIAVGINEEGQALDTEGNPWISGDNRMHENLFSEEYRLIEEEPAAVEPEKPKRGRKTKHTTETPTEDTSDVTATASKKGGRKSKTKTKPETETETATVSTVEGDVATAPTLGHNSAGAVIEDSEGVREILREQDAVSAAKQLISMENRTNFTLGGVLHHIEQTGLAASYGMTGKKGFETFCASELGIDYRKARYLIDIYVKFRQIGFDERRLEAIGWSKAKELARISTEQLARDVDALLEYALENTRENLIEHIKTNYEVATRSETVKMVRFSFKLPEEAAVIAQEALTLACHTTQEEDMSRAFGYICSDWLNTAAGSDLDLDAFVAMGVSRFGKEAILVALEAMEDTGSVSEIEQDQEEA
jgi:hypothetical protein